MAITIGYPVTQNSINSRSASLAIQLENLASDSARFASEITTIGGISGLETIGFTSGDAGAIYILAALLGQIASVYFGTSDLLAAVNFDSQMNGARGLGAPG